MKSERFFVTSVLFLFTMAVLGCDSYHSTQKPAAGTGEDKPAIEAANAKARQTLVLQAELLNDFGIYLHDVRDPAGKVIKAAALAMDYNWMNLTKAQRMAAKEKLAQYLALVNEILEIDARKGLFVTNKDRVINGRDAAYRFRKSVENFEKIMGENFEPKPNPGRPAYSKSYEV